MGSLIAGAAAPRSDVPLQTAGARGAKPLVRACALLTKEEVKKLAGSKDQFFDMVTPTEQKMPGTGSACEYSGINIQVDPFTPARLEELRKEKGSHWETVTGVGDRAYLFDNKPAASLHFAELYATVGARVFTIQMTVRPSGASVDTVRPELLALAKAIVEKLR